MISCVLIFCEPLEFPSLGLILAHPSTLYVLCCASYLGCNNVAFAFISRNEDAAEWKWNIFYVVPGSRADECIPMNDLSDDEFNEQFNSFMCHPTWNPYDQECI